jgi:hypothetical protein
MTSPEKFTSHKIFGKPIRIAIDVLNENPSITTSSAELRFNLFYYFLLMRFVI